ncbi:hypothetical protein JCM10450v2_004946 [Rhodotorula kratochvilovae]
MRRIIVCCDGTWESALFQTRTDMLTNVSRLCNAINTRDERDGGVEQVKLYLAGLGTGEETLEGAITGAIGEGLLDQVRQAYHFIAQNWTQGDEILLFGFSRGAYVCRLLTALLHLIGVLDPKTNLHLFPAIFNALCLPKDPKTKAGERNVAKLDALLEEIEPFVEAQEEAAHGGFFVKVLGVFECVPLLRFPHLTDPSLAHLTPFSTPDALLEPTVQHVFQALALNERRAPYRAIEFVQDPVGQERGQELTQVWFAGCHGDVGGGYDPHELSDLSLHWLVSQVAPFVALDYTYLASISASPSAPWGEAAQHEGFHLAPGRTRTVPLPLVTRASPAATAATQFLHPAVLRQPREALPRRLQRALDEAERAGAMMGKGGVWWTMGAWEKSVQARWAVKRTDAGTAGGASGRRRAEREMQLWRTRVEQVYNAGDAPSLASAR